MWMHYAPQLAYETVQPTAHEAAQLTSQPADAEEGGGAVGTVAAVPPPSASDAAKLLKMQDQWLLGADLLVKPVMTEGAASSSVYLPQVPSGYVQPTTRYSTLRGAAHYAAPRTTQRRAQRSAAHNALLARAPYCQAVLSERCSLLVAGPSHLQPRTRSV